jgi:hypothetical protein
MRRGSVLLTVVMIVVVTAVSLAAFVQVAAVDSTVASYSAREQRLRAAAMGAVSLAAETAQAQRMELLRGGQLQLPERVESLPGVDVTYLAVRGGTAGAPGENTSGVIGEDVPRSLPESAFLNLNHCSPAQLRAKLGAVADDVTSKKPLLTGAELLRGVRSQRNVTLETVTSLTAHSWDPQVYLDDSGQAAHPRLVLGSRADEVPGVIKPVADAILPLMSEEWEGKSLAEAGKALSALPPDILVRVLDVLAQTSDTHIPGRIDILRADSATISAVLQLSSDQSDKVVSLRETLTPAQRLDTGFLLTSKLVTPAKFLQIVDKITLRTMQWRIRAAAAQAGQRVVIEATIDASDVQCRVAFAHEVTFEREVIAVTPRRPNPQAVVASGSSVSAEPPAVTSGSRPPPAQPETPPAEPSSRDARSDESPPIEKPKTPAGPRRWGRWGGG